MGCFLGRGLGDEPAGKCPVSGRRTMRGQLTTDWRERPEPVENIGVPNSQPTLHPQQALPVPSPAHGLALASPPCQMTEHPSPMTRNPSRITPVDSVTHMLGDSNTMLNHCSSFSYLLNGAQSPRYLVYSWCLIIATLTNR